LGWCQGSQKTCALLTVTEKYSSRQTSVAGAWLKLTVPASGRLRPGGHHEWLLATLSWHKSGSDVWTSKTGTEKIETSMDLTSRVIGRGTANMKYVLN
jgi:hypothetical protein